MKIMVMLPYPELRQLFETAIHEMDCKDLEFDVRIAGGTSDPAILNENADIVIARGITGLMFRKLRPEIHLVELKVSGYEVFNALVECKKFHVHNVILLAHETLFYNVEALKKMTGLEVSAFTANNEDEIILAIKKGISMGGQAFVGGSLTCSICNSMGCLNVHYLVGIETIKHSLEEVRDIAHSLNAERTKTAMLKKLLNSGPDGILFVDQDGNIREANEKALHIIGIQPSALTKEQNIKEVLPNHDWDVMPDSIEESESLHHIHGNLYMVLRTPLRVDGHSAGLLMTIRNADEIRQSETRIRSELRHRGLVAKYTFEDIWGNSASLRKNIEAAYKYSKTDLNVLIVGETGTGKELFAHSIHNASRRANEPFVAVNCAALPENLLESELFGYAEGAFTGAARGGKPGLFELAHKGTIFLDEIGELPVSLQAKLLRVLQEKEIRRIGDSKVIPIDVHVISATNINIKEKIASGKFRSDLYFRLNLLNLSLYPLRNRPEDVEFLLRRFLEIDSRKIGRAPVKVTADVLRLLQKYSWPGNVRELKNLCERLVVLNETGTISVQEIEDINVSNEVYTATLKEPAEINDLGTQEQAVLQLIREGCIKKGEIAKILGISRTTLWRRMNNHE